MASAGACGTTYMSTAWETREVTLPADIAAAVTGFCADDEFVWLDSAPNDGPTLVCARPVAVIEQSGGQAAELHVGGRVVERSANGWALWEAVSRRLPRWPAVSLPLVPGWGGYAGVESAGQLERLPDPPPDDFALPILRWALYDGGIVLDGQTRRATAVAAPGLRAELGLRASEPIASLAERWTAACAVGRVGPASLPAASRTTAASLPASAATEARPAGLWPPPRVTAEMPPDAYERMVRRALAYIAAGDIYQVNLCQRLRLDGLPEPLEAYAALRTANPAPFGGVLRWADGAILSSSPELMLRVRGDEVLTSPIKGTRPRGASPADDARLRAKLLASAKDAAELTMIVDLHRNDLGRVCRYGSVRVAAARRVEAHPAVFHTVADVVGRLAPGHDALAALRACFPAGSITGVPKIRAQQIIAELEPVARGAYTGALGVLGLDGRLTCCVAIRIIQQRGSTGVLHVGGGIVADSQPAAEYAETLAKARGTLLALRTVAPDRTIPAAAR